MFPETVAADQVDGAGDHEDEVEGSANYFAGV
jgi:hypothetical protein